MKIKTYKFGVSDLERYRYIGGQGFEREREFGGYEFREINRNKEIWALWFSERERLEVR